MKLNKDQILSIIAIAVSTLAFFISFLSYKTSERALQLEEARFSMLNTPTIIDKQDSNYVEFSLDKGILQRVLIYFPTEVKKEPKYLEATPFKLRTESLEELAESIISEHNEPADSTFTAGYFSLPVIIQYSSNILSYEETLRENRFLRFFFTNSKDNTEATYNSTILINRVGYPIKSQSFWTVPFTTVSEEKIYRQDSIDLYQFLDKQFEIAKKKLGANSR